MTPAEPAGSAWNGAASAVVTLLWALPLAAFVAAHADAPPPSPLLPLVAAFAIAGIVASAWLPASYFRSRRFEMDGRLYRRLGVPAFGVVVPGGALLNRLAGARRVWRGRPAELARIEEATRASEHIHWWWLLTSAAVVTWAWGIGARRTAVLLLLLNVPLNVYPILLQRSVRARLVRIRHARRIGQANLPARHA